MHRLTFVAITTLGLSACSFLAAARGMKDTRVASVPDNYDKLVVADPSLPERLAKLPGRVFSGKRQPSPETTAVFFCYALPDHDASTDTWTEDAGRAGWYLYDLATGKIQDDPTPIAAVVRCVPETPRHCAIPRETLAEVRAKIEKHIKSSYLKSVQAPVGVVPVLKAWMELN